MVVARAPSFIIELFQWPTSRTAAPRQLGIAGLVMLVSGFLLAAWIKIAVSVNAQPDIVARAEQEARAQPRTSAPSESSSGQSPGQATVAAPIEEAEPQTWTELMDWFQVHLMNGAPAPAIPLDEVSPRIARLRADLPQALHIVNEWATALNVRREALLQNAQNVAAVLQTKDIATQSAHADAVAELRRLWASVSEGYGERGIQYEGDFTRYLDGIDQAYLTGTREPALLLYELELVRVFFVRSLYRFSLKDADQTQLVALARALATSARRTDVVRALGDERLLPAAVHVQAAIAAQADAANRLAKGLPAPLPPALQAYEDGHRRDVEEREAFERQADRVHALAGEGVTGNPFVDSATVDLQELLNRARHAAPPPPVDWNSEVQRLLAPSPKTAAKSAPPGGH